MFGRATLPPTGRLIVLPDELLPPDGRLIVLPDELLPPTGRLIVLPDELLPPDGRLIVPAPADPPFGAVVVPPLGRVDHVDVDPPLGRVPPTFDGRLDGAAGAGDAGRGAW